MIRVRFVTASGIYFSGDQAAFPPDEAGRLIAAGAAVDVEAADADAKAKADAEAAEADAKAKADAEAAETDAKAKAGKKG